MSINIDYSQDGNSLFENVYITGILDYDFSGDNLEVNKIKINEEFIVGKELTVGTSASVTNDFYAGGIGTFGGDVDILGDLNVVGRLDLNYLTVKKEFEVGIGGTILTAKDTNDRVGIGNSVPLQKLQINSSGRSVVVSAGGTVGIATTNPYGWVDSIVGGGQSTYGAPSGKFDGSSEQVAVYDWTCPEGVTQISVLCIGGGGGGAGSGGIYGGGGAGLGYTTLTVVPGQIYEVGVGAGGEHGDGDNGSASGSYNGHEGGDSWFKNGNGADSVIVAFAEGGGAGALSESVSAGGTYLGLGGGNGGDGGRGDGQSGSGGGGCGGYNGDGGRGGDEEESGSAAAVGSGGGGGGGSCSTSTDEEGGGGGGGGVGLYGLGSSGGGGALAADGANPGEGGSGGNDGKAGGDRGELYKSQAGWGGSYGGGGGKAGGERETNYNRYVGGDGGNGRVRIVWSYGGGAARAYPSTGTLTDIDAYTGFSDIVHGPLKLDIQGSLHISRNIYDSSGSAGDNNWWMRRDETGIRWVAVDPERSDGIYLQDEGTYIPSVGAAASFSTINFAQENSLGLGTDTLRPTVGGDDTQGSAGLATVFTKDLWGTFGSGDTASIYRMTNVGIQTSQPIQPFQVGTGFINSSGVTSTFVITNVGDVGIGSTLPQSGLDVYKSTLIQGALNVTGIGTFENDVFIKADGKNFKIQNAGGTDKFRVTTTDGNTDIKGTLNVLGISTFKDDVEFHGVNGISSAYWDKSANAFRFIDETKATFGTNNDLRISHTYSLASQNDINGDSIVDGWTSYIHENGAGSLIFKTDGGPGEGAYQFFDVNWRPILKLYSGSNARASLYHGGAEKLETTTHGIDVTGHTETDTLQVSGISTFTDYAQFGDNINVIGISTFVGISTFKDEVGIAKTLDLGSHIIDVNQDIGVGAAQTDYRLASVGSGVSWRPSGVETKNTIWVSINGNDSNSGLLEGDSKRTIGAAAAIAETGDTIVVRSGVYKENNPIGLRTEVTVSGEDLRLVTVVPNNVNKDVFQVRAGCLIQNLNFAGQTSSTNHPNMGAVAFPPTSAGIAAGIDYQAVTGYTTPGPANQGPDRVDPTKGARYRSPYVRNCTNFMTGSIGMKINGDYVNAAFTGTNDLGQDLKSMVCDSFTQYNQNGIGVSLTNNAYAQLVSIFTIGCDIAIFAGSGGQCDLTNSNSSFGNFGLYSDGVGDVEFIGITNTSSIGGQDVIQINGVRDTAGNVRKPFDGQGAYFHIDMDDYPDSTASGIVTQPLQFIRGINIVDGGSGYSQAAPPIVTVNTPQGPEPILPEFSANVSAAGTISSIDVIASGRNFLPDQELTVTFSSGDATATVDTDPILFTIDVAQEPTDVGLTTVTFNEFIPYSIGLGVTCEFVRLSRIITSSHSFEYVGAGTDLNKANPFQGGEPVPENEIVAINGGQVPFTSTDQKGNFKIGEGLIIDQTTSTISGRDFNRAIQAQLTPLILALR